MSDRVQTPMTNEHFAAFCRSMVGQPYWYGTCLYKCTESLRSRKAAQYPSHYASGRTARYRQDISEKKVCADCIGAAKGYAWTGGGLGVLEAIGTDKTYASSYGSHGCPDKGADSMFTYAKSKGADWGGIDTLPEVVGLALHKEGHVGYYVGNGEAVEWKSFADGCVKTKVAGRGWTSWCPPSPASGSWRARPSTPACWPWAGASIRYTATSSAPRRRAPSQATAIWA